MEERNRMKGDDRPRSGEEAPQPREQGHNSMWIIIAIAIDRFFVLVYLVMTVLLVTTLFLNHPYIKG